MSQLLITLDGPGGTGKSTVSRAVADAAGLPHLDTGAFYRAATLAVLRAGVSPEDASAVGRLVSELDLDQRAGAMYLDGEDVSGAIRSDDVTRWVSAVSAHPEVRSQLVAMQRAWVESRGGRGVVEGRDIGSIVFPDADLKFYLDASPRVRAERRAKETGEDLAEVLADLQRRDHADSNRAASPMSVPKGALIVDTSELAFEEVVERVLSLIETKS